MPEDIYEEEQLASDGSSVTRRTRRVDRRGNAVEPARVDSVQARREEVVREEQGPTAAELQYLRYTRIRQAIYYLLDIFEVLLAGRFLLRLLGANPAAGFVRFVYDVSDPLMAPFRGIFPSAAARGSVFEWSILVAMAVYALVAYGLIQLIALSLRNEPPRNYHTTYRHSAI